MIKYKNLVSSNGGREIHAILTVDHPGLPFSDQLKEVENELSVLLRDQAARMTPVFMRWFLSDVTNQAQYIPKVADCAVSIVGQPPLDYTKVALWIWLVDEAEVIPFSNVCYCVRHGAYSHIYEGNRGYPDINSRSATYNLLKSTETNLKAYGGSLISNCVRTWLFVQNIDVNYKEVVAGRNALFNECGLTRDTRFIASTGIGGHHRDRSVIVQMDSYSVLGLQEGQMRMVNAPDFLNPTYEYGVAFERATSIDYGDRRHLFVSGTASIDNKGEVVWEGDVQRQTGRMLTNVEALLKAADCRWNDVGQMLVYLRDPADSIVVGEIFANRFPETPYVILWAPVCRPAWLVEMECIAMKPIITDFSVF